MFKKIIVVSLLTLQAVNATQLEEAHNKITYLLNTCNHSQEWILNPLTKSYSLKTSTPKLKNIYSLIEDTIEQLDPATRMLLLFNDKNMLNALPAKLQRKEPIAIAHSNPEIFSCLQNIYKKYASEMYVAFITYAISKCPPQNYKKMLSKLKELPSLKNKNDWEAILKHNNMALKAFGTKFADAKKGSPQGSLALDIGFTLTTYYAKTNLLEEV